MSYYNGSAYTFTWDGRRLASVEKGLFYATFTYNDEGLRLSTTINGATTTYLYDGSVLIAEYAPNYTCVYIYDESGAIIGAKYISTSAGSSWQTYFFEKNLQGDVIAVYSDTGTKLVSYIYDAWGNATTTYHNGGASTLAANNPIRYRSYYYDTTLQMYYLQSRYYDAKICRFINADGYISTGQGVLGYNMFAYCNNNPISYIDPSGESLITAFVILLAGALIGGVIGGVAVAVSAEVQEKEVSPVEIVKGVAVGTAFGISGAGIAITMIAAPSIITYGASKALLWGVASVQVAALGILSCNLTPMILLPLLGLEGEAVEYGEPYNTRQPIFK